GQYLPVFASTVCDNKPRLVNAGFAPINISSVMIGNGLTDVPTMVPAWVDVQCSPVSIFPVQDIGTDPDVVIQLPRCTKWLKDACQDQFDRISCSAALKFFFTSMLDPYIATG
ncbi:hypothetical protein B0H17DRAFT_875465, partial [Mycena rosella]